MTDFLVTLDLTASFDPAAADAEEDRRLVEALREGGEEAYETLLARFQQPVYNLVARLLQDPGDAPDVVQDIFLKIFRKISGFRGQSSLKTWVYRIAVNEAHNHRRWHGRHRRREVGLEECGSLVDTSRDGARSPFETAVAQESRALLEQALAALSPVLREAVVLRDVEDLSYEEIAEILQVPLGTVKSRILRGREALRAELEKRLAPAAAVRWAPQAVE
ncbi:MAG: sigma-70 family RNA polymerase sigma factor [Bryobacterales bacterium]|nr:sigma-70 family RNA polymerase sigma factor [Bryobacteraceae bacterium]MDW8354265.1 sigma-70 family RNA polymerase sigma factor [Bryobacterales bacterium]